MIKWFKGKHSWLDNSYEVDVPYDGMWYPSVTHAFLAAGTLKKSLRIKISVSPLNELSDLVDDIKRDSTSIPGPDIMRALLESKFGYSRQGIPGRNMKLMKYLVETADSKLEFGNYTHSTFWGICHCPEHESGTNTNVLGGLLMGVRERWATYIAIENERQTTCQCDRISLTSFLYSVGFTAFLMPYCQVCQAKSAEEAYHLSSDGMVIAFPGKPRPPEDKIIQLHRHRRSSVFGPRIQQEEVRQIMHRQIDDLDEDAAMMGPLGMMMPHTRTASSNMNTSWGRSYQTPIEDRQWKGRVIKC